MLTLALFVLFRILACLRIEHDALIFRSPEYSMQNPNFTIGALFQLLNEDGSPNRAGVSDALTMYCSLQLYANGSTEIPVKGIFNLLGFEDRQPLQNELNALMNLEGQNLFHYQNRSQLGPVPDTPIGAIFASPRLSETYYFNAPLEFLPLTLFSHVKADGPDINELALQSSSSGNYGLQIAAVPMAFLLTSAIASLMLSFNWTLMGLIYSNNPYGAAAQEVSIDFLGFNETIAVRCEMLYLNSTSITNFSRCIKESQQVRVITLWMGLVEAIDVAEQITEETGLQDELVFIFPFAGAQISQRLKFPVMSFYYTSAAYTASAAFGTDCPREAIQKDYLPEDVVENYYLRYFNCSVTNTALDVCTEPVEDRATLCYCTGKEPAYDFYVSREVDIFIKTISMMQNNCSSLTEQAALLFPNASTPNYCALPSFNTSDLAYAVKSVQVTEYGEPFRLSKLSTVRARMDLFLMQVQPNEVVQLGFFEQFNLTINTSAAFFYTNIKSEVVPDNPSISTSSLSAAGFGMNIALMVLTVSVMLFVLWKRRHPVIRKSSPVFCMLILLGILFIELSLMFYTFGLTDAICYLDDVFLLTGISLIIANLLMKSYRIYAIFHNSSATAVHISDKILLLWSMVILLMTWTMFVLYSTLGGGLHAIIIQSKSNRFYQFVMCEVDNGTFQNIFLISFYVYFVILFLAAAVLGFLNRKVASVYSESQEVVMVVYSWLGLVILYAPIYYVQGDSTDSKDVRFAVRLMSTLLASFFTLLFLYYPKVHKVFLDEYRNRNR